MPDFHSLAIALSDFLGTEVTGEDIQSFDFKVEDPRTDFVFESSLDMDSGVFRIYVSEYVPNLKQHLIEAEDSNDLDIEGTTMAISNLAGGIRRLDALAKVIVKERAELDIDTAFDKVTSTYRATLNKKDYFSRDPNEIASIIETYIQECKSTRVDLLNDRLRGYTNKTIKFGENFECYRDGLFLSIYYRTRTNFVITFHPSPDVDQWSRYECASMKSFNEAVDKILGRLS